MILSRDYPRCRRPLIVLILGSFVLNVELVARGPWSARVPILLWPVVGGSLTLWLSNGLRIFCFERRSDIATTRLGSSEHRAPSRAERTE